MSSIVNKSGKRFAPKLKGRRSIPTPTPPSTQTPTNISNNTVEISEVVITDDRIFKEAIKTKESQQQEKSTSNDDNEGSDNASESDNDLPLTPAPTQISRRSSTIDHTETRQRRLSTLSTTSKPPVFGERRVSFTSSAGKPVLNAQIFGERRASITSTTIIGIPQPPKRRKSSTSGPRKRRASATPVSDPKTILIDGSARRRSVAPLPTPASTQQEATIQEEHEHEQELQSTLSQQKKEQKATPDVLLDINNENVKQPQLDNEEEDETIDEDGIENGTSGVLPPSPTKPATISTKNLVKKLTSAKDLSDDSVEEEEKKSKGAGTESSKESATSPVLFASPAVEPVFKRTKGEKEGFVLDKATDKVRKVFYDDEHKDMYEFITEDFKVENYKQIAQSFSQLDPSISETMTLDETKFTIADLCKPNLPIGKVSSNFHLAREAQKSKMMQRMERRKIRQQAKLERRSVESFNPVEDEPQVKKVKAEDIFEAKEEVLPNNQGIQLKVGADGKLIVDEESRIVDRKSNMEGLERERHDQNPFENLVNSASYGRRRYTDKWDEDEVFKLYKSISQWGTDFGIIAQMFPHRTRTQVKNRFLLEEKKRPRLVELALMNKLNVEFNFDDYCDEANKQFGTLDEFNAKLGNLKTEHEQNMKELQAAKEKAKEEDAVKQKQKEMEIRNRNSGLGRNMTRQERLLELKKNETVLGSIEDIKKQRGDEADVEIPQ